jgi:hypothetical protein
MHGAACFATFYPCRYEPTGGRDVQAGGRRHAFHTNIRIPPGKENGIRHQQLSEPALRVMLGSCLISAPRTIYYNTDTGWAP